MKAAKKDDSGIFDSILVHFGDDRARFHPTHLKINRSMITLPTAWQFKPMTEIGITLELPTKGKAGKTNKGPIECRGIIVECRPLKRKGQFQVDLLLTDLPSRHEAIVKKLVPSPKESLG